MNDLILVTFNMFTCDGRAFLVGDILGGLRPLRDADITICASAWIGDLSKIMVDRSPITVIILL